MKFLTRIQLTALAPLALLGACQSTAQDSSTPHHAAHSGAKNAVAEPAAFELPPGWTEGDMAAYAMAATPGAMHEHLQKTAGTWRGTTTMWTAPGSAPRTSPVTNVLTPVMDGRYLRCEYIGEIPGMGPFQGLGFYGYDNVSKSFVSTWMDNQSTGIMYGTGAMSADGKQIDWTFQFNCPITQKPTVMREIERYEGDNKMTLEMSGADPKTGVEYTMMKIELERTSPAH